MMGETIIVREDGVELTPCQLKYLIEWQRFGEQVCLKWANRNHSLEVELSKMQKQMEFKDRNTAKLVQQTEKRCNEEFQIEKNKVQRQMTNILIGKEKKFNERIRKLEDTLLDREKEIFELRSDQSMNEIQKDLESFVRDETLFRQCGEIHNMIDDVECQYIKYVDSLKQEIKNLQLDIQKNNANNRLQLNNLRAELNTARKSLDSAVNFTEEEKNKLSEENRQLTKNYSIQVQKLKSDLFKERNTNKTLNEQLLNTREELNKKHKWANEEISRREKILKNKMLNDYQTATNLNKNTLTKNLKQINFMLDEFEIYLPRVVNNFSVLKSANKDLMSNRLTRLKDASIEAENKNVELRAEIIHLKKEISKINDSLKTEVEKKVAEVNKQKESEFIELKKNLETAMKREQNLKILLKEENKSSNDKDLLLKIKDRRISQLNSDLENLKSRLAKTKREKVAKAAEQIDSINGFDRTRIVSPRKKKSVYDRVMSSGDHGMATIEVRDSIKKKYILPDKQKSNTNQNTCDSVETNDQSNKAECKCNMPAFIIDQFKLELQRKIHSTNA